jgi:hypothetical protein
MADSAANLRVVDVDLLDREFACIKDQVKSAAEVRDEKFQTFHVRFTELEKRTKDLDEARAVALAAALAAAKELVGASNTNFTRQIDTLLATFDRQIGSLDSKVNDLKDRLGLMEGQRFGGQTFADNRHKEVTTFTSIISAVVCIGALLATLAFNALHIPH